jgi:hypothetical protein
MLSDSFSCANTPLSLLIFSRYVCRAKRNIIEKSRIAPNTAPSTVPIIVAVSMCWPTDELPVTGAVVGLAAEEAVDVVETCGGAGGALVVRVDAVVVLKRDVVVLVELPEVVLGRDVVVLVELSEVRGVVVGVALGGVVLGGGGT